MDKRMKIIFVIDSMAGGGAQRVMATMASYWAKKDHEIHFIIFYKKDIFYALHSSVNIHQLNFDYGCNGKLYALRRI